MSIHDERTAPRKPTQGFLARPRLFIGAGGIIVAGAALAWLLHPAWAILAIVGGMALILAPDRTS